MVLFSRQREKSTFQRRLLPFSLRGERKGRKESPLKGKTHGFSLEKPFSLQCACLPLASLSRAHSLGYGKCAVKMAVCRRAATALEQRRRGQSPRSVCRGQSCQPFGYGEAGWSAEGGRANRFAISVGFQPEQVDRDGCRSDPVAGTRRSADLTARKHFRGSENERR